MSTPLDDVKMVFEEAMGPYQKRQVIIEELKGSGLGKAKRAQLADEAEELEKEWTAALVELEKAMQDCPDFQAAKGR